MTLTNAHHGLERKPRGVREDWNEASGQAASAALGGACAVNKLRASSCSSRKAS